MYQRQSWDLTREEAIELLVELDVARWGEAERAASARLHAPLTKGRALNALAHRPEVDYGRSAPPALLAAARAALTDAGRHDLYQGG